MQPILRKHEYLPLAASLISEAAWSPDLGLALDLDLFLFLFKRITVSVPVERQRQKSMSMPLHMVGVAMQQRCMLLKVGL